MSSFETDSKKNRVTEKKGTGYINEYNKLYRSLKTQNP